MPFPLAGQRFIVEAFDNPQTLRAGKPGDVFPFFVTLQHLNRNSARKLFVDATVFFDLPHALLCIYQYWYVKESGVLTHNVLAQGRAAGLPAKRPFGAKSQDLVGQAIFTCRCCVTQSRR